MCVKRYKLTNFTHENFGTNGTRTKVIWLPIPSSFSLSVSHSLLILPPILSFPPHSPSQPLIPSSFSLSKPLIPSSFSLSASHSLLILPPNLSFHPPHPYPTNTYLSLLQPTFSLLPLTILSFSVLLQLLPILHFSFPSCSIFSHPSQLLLILHFSFPSFTFLSHPSQLLPILHYAFRSFTTSTHPSLFLFILHYFFSSFTSPSHPSLLHPILHYSFPSYTLLLPILYTTPSHPTLLLPILPILH